MIALAVVTAALLLRLVADGVVATLADDGVSVEPIRIDLNRARISELMLLEGIGRTRAEQIVLHRVRHGWFECVDDLTAVDGIGAETVRRLRGAVVVRGPVDQGPR